MLDTYDWQTSYTHGAAIFRQELTNNIDVPDFLAAIDAVQTPTGAACFVSTTANASRYPGCIPLDVFGVGNEAAAAENFIFQPTRWRLTNLSDDYTGSITGSPLDNWAGPVSVALNAEYRQLSMLETTSANPLNPVSLAGLRDVPRPPPSSVFAYATVAPSQGANSVWEVSSEAVVPIVKDMAFAKSLDLNGAVRFTDYSTSGSVWTWKAGLDYQPVNDLRIRATESRDIRAPTLYDLFAGQSALVRNLNDPHTNTSRVLNIITQGDPNLVPEVALTTTAGVVYSPSWFQNFRMSVDYYSISLDNAITTLSGNDPTILQQCEAVQWSSPVCSTLIARPLPFSNTSPANFPTAVYSEPFNVARTWTNGVDVEASYGFDLADIADQLPGNLVIRLLYSYQPTLDTINFTGSTTTNAAGAVGLSSSRATVMIDYMAGPVRLGWSTRYYSPEQRSGTPGQIFADGEISSYTISDVNLDLLAELNDHTIDFFVNVQNIFDVQPRIAPNITFSGIPGFGDGTVPGDDLIGRYVIVGLRLRY